MLEEKITPVDEMMPYEEFTDRVELLRELDLWIKDISRMASSSTSIISPRRLGKTSLLDRLVNTVFLNDYNVAVFYYKMRREEITLRQFLLDYATMFFRQYIAYCVKDPAMYGNADYDLAALLEVESDHKAVLLAKDSIKAFLKRYNGNTYEDTRNHWDAFITVPERLASYSGTRVAIIIDEFQDMKFYVYDSSDTWLKEWMDKNKGKPSYSAVDLTATFDRLSQSRKAPMLVSGSAVTLVFRTVMGGPLGGRFGFKYLKPLSIPDGATLITKLLMKKGTVIDEENAIYISSETQGHPYYLYCCAETDYKDKSFNTKEGIDNTLKYEIENGKIYGFWQTHFDDNRELINNDNDIELGKKIIYYFTKYNNEPVDIKEIAAKLDVPPADVEKKIENLYKADLVYRTAARYYTFNDICLMRFIRFVYERDLEGIEKINYKQQGAFNVVKGRFLELAVENVMWKFNKEELDGKLFGQEGHVIAPLFGNVGSKTVQPDNSRAYQIDVFGKWERGLGDEFEIGLWTVECKYRRQPMTLDEAKKAIHASTAFLKAEYQKPEGVKHKIWLVSTGGFTAELLGFIREGGLFYSGHEEINELFRQYGGGIKIPAPDA